MSRPKLMRTVTEEREVTGVIRDLVYFALYLEEKGVVEPGHPLHEAPRKKLDPQELIQHASDFWDREHGE